MSFNPYGANPYGAPPGFNSFPGSQAAPGMAPPPGLGPPPGMSSAPGLAPPPGVQQPSGATQANRPSGVPPSFQPPAGIPNFNFSAPVIRLGGGASSLPPKPGLATAASGRRESDSPLSGGPNRSGPGPDRGEHTRGAMREAVQALVPPTDEEKLRTIFIHQIPEGAGADGGVEKLLKTLGNLRRWDSGKSHLSDHKGELFGFAQFDDVESLATAVELLKDVQVPLKKQEAGNDPPRPARESSADEPSSPASPPPEIKKRQLQVMVDPSTTKYLEAYLESRGDEAKANAESKLESARSALQAVVHDLFHPPRQNNAQNRDGDVGMGEGGADGSNVEVINIPLAQEDELADIPAAMREVVAAEIAAFRERSNQRDMERLRREEEFEEMERLRNGAPHPSRNDSPPPRSAPAASSVPKGPSGGQGRSMAFINGGTDSDYKEGGDTDTSDNELHRRQLAKQAAEDDKQYLEAERKWVNRERQRAAALERETDRDKTETEGVSRRMEEQQEREKAWNDERELSRKGHLYYRDHATWIRKRAQDRAGEEARDEADRRAEAEEQRRQVTETEPTRDVAGPSLRQQALEETERQRNHARQSPPAAASAAAPQRFTISFGAGQKTQLRAGGVRRSVAEVEGLLDDEEHDSTVKRQLVPIKFEPTAASAMSEEDITKAVRALAQEIPTEKGGLWAWDVKWDYMDDSVIRDRLRPFVEKKVVEYLGVQEQFLVEVVEEHLRKHGKPAELVEELAEALDDAAEDLVKKLWRMVIFFTESEKRGLPA